MLSQIFTFVVLTLASVLSDSTEELSSNDYFTSAIYREVLENDNSNFVVSPFSLKTLLGLLQNGASGETKEEIRTVLGVIPTMLDNQNLYNANKIYLKKRYRIKEEFRTLVDGFGGEVETIDFTNRFSTIKTINQWVKKHTGNNIDYVIIPNNIGSNTRAVLISALYFTQNWYLPFKETRKQNFYPNSNKVVKVNTLCNDLGLYKYSESEELDAKILEIQFQDDESSMVFVLPNKIDGIEELNEEIAFLPQQFSEEYVNVSIPKFTIETRMNLKPILENLGIRKAFTFGQANFSAITDQKLAITSVIQKTVISVNEDGVGATSNTVPQIEVDEVNEVIQFHADHPFLFYVKVKDLIILAGKVEQPDL